VQAAGCRDGVNQGLQLRRRAALDHDCHQRCRISQAERQARTAWIARGQDSASGSGAAGGPLSPGPGSGRSAAVCAVLGGRASQQKQRAVDQGQVPANRGA
jgi:hypothetical protein